jgi:cytochrome c-type biogenesis protein
VKRIVWLASLAAGVACGGPGGNEAAAGAGRVDVGLPVPPYRTQSLAGDSVSLSALKGKVVMLNVWATWCHPCRDEIPELRVLYDRYRSRGLELVGVSVDADGAQENVREFMQEFEMHYPVWLDPAERISAQFLVVGVPATFLIDKQGVLRWRKTGPIQPGDSTLTAAIEQALTN